MPATMERFGVALKSSQPVEKAVDEDKIDRAKASIFTWDDEKLQKTAVVQKKITKAAISVQRFIRACLSHWRYFNEERGPMIEELEDIKRRRVEELEDVEAFKKRGFEQARFEFEAQMAMPAEEFEKTQKLSRQLRQEIKDTEEATKEVAKGIINEKDRAKKLGREEHENKAQHTLSRLDVEVPALEAERSELEEANNEFGDVVNALAEQLNGMNGQIKIEERHKKRLLRTLAKMVKELEARGAKPKVVNAVKLSIMYKGEDPPPKPPAPAPKSQAEPSPESEPTPAPDAESTKLQKKDSEGASSEDSASKAADSCSQDESEHKPNKGASQSSDLLRASTGSTDALQSPLKSPKSRRGGNLRATTGPGGAPDELMKRRGMKKSKSPDSAKKDGAFDWGDKEKVRRATLVANKLKMSRSVSPSARKKDKDRRGGKKEIPKRSKSIDWEKFGEEAAKAKKGASKSIDWEKIRELTAKAEKKGASFDWSAMAEAGEEEKKGKKSSKDKDKDKSKKKKEKRDSTVGQDGHFSWAFHAKNS